MLSKSTFIAGVSWTAVGLVAAAFVTLAHTAESDRQRRAIRPDDGCLANADPPAVTMIVNDATDPLTGDQPRRWNSAVRAEVAQLPPGAVLLIGSIGPSAPTEIEFVKLCVPISGRGTTADALQEGFHARLAEVGAELERSPSSARSAITATIASGATDPLFAGGSTGTKRIQVNSDLLENDSASVYEGSAVELPPLPNDTLAGTTVRFTVLRNPRDAALQNRALIESWVQWAKAGGAQNVEVDAPWLGYRAVLSSRPPA